jgi:hypothetical protein
MEVLMALPAGAALVGRLAQGYLNRHGPDRGADRGVPVRRAGGIVLDALPLDANGKLNRRYLDH